MNEWGHNPIEDAPDYCDLPEWHDLPEEAQEAYKNWQDWEWHPETAEGCDWFAVEGESSWYQVCYPVGVRIEDGQIFDVFYRCDEDGDWDVEAELDWFDPERDQVFKDISFEEFSKSQARYLSYVAETGNDPLRLLMVDTHYPTRDVKWQFVIRNSFVGPALVAVRRNARGEWVTGKHIPFRVADYFVAEQPDTSSVWRITWTDFDGLREAIDKHDTFVRWQRTYNPTEIKGIIGIPMKEPRPESAVRRERKRLASRNLRRIRKELEGIAQ